MLAFLNPGSQADHRPSARSAAQNVVQTVHAILPGGLYRLPYDVPDSQEL